MPVTKTENYERLQTLIAQSAKLEKSIADLQELQREIENDDGDMVLGGLLDESIKKLWELSGNISNRRFWAGHDLELEIRQSIVRRV